MLSEESGSSAQPVSPDGFEPPDPVARWATPHRTHVLSPLGMMGTLAKQFLGLALVALAVGRLWLLVAVLAMVVVGGVASWWRRTWSFDGEVIILDQGLFERQARRVPVGRIQQVELVQPLIHRLVGLAVITVSTAGGAVGSGIELEALSYRDAVDLRSALLSARARAHTEPTPPSVISSSPPPPPIAEPVLTLSTPRLVLAGLTSSTLLVTGTLALAVVDTLADLPDNVVGSVEDGAQSFAESLNWFTAIVSILVVVGVGAAVGSVAMHHRLTVVKVGDELRMWRGLFERKDAVLPLARVQAVVVRQNPIQRLLGMAAVRIRSAGGKGTQDSMTVPLADADQIARLVEAATGVAVDLGGLTPAPPPALPRRIVRRLAGVALVVGSVLVVWSPGWTGALIVATVSALAAVAWGFDAYRNMGFRIDELHVVIRGGSLLRRTSIVTLDRVQSTGSAVSPMQRRAGVATLTLDLAGVGARTPVIDQLPVACNQIEGVVRAHAEPARV